MHIHFIRRAALAALLVPLCVHAETPSYGALLERAQADAPRMLEQAANVRATEAEARQATAWLNPTLNATYENLGAPTSGGVSQRQDTYALTQLFELGGKRAARIDAQQGRASAAGARALETRLAFAAELAIAYASAEAMQQRRAIAKAELERGNDDLRAAQALVTAGREAALRLAQAKASVAAAQAAVQATSANLTEALEHLSALVGVREPFIRIDIPFLATIRALPVAADWSPEQAPSLAAAAADFSALAAQIKVEKKRWLPDVGVSLGMRKFGLTGEKAATVGISANIPLFDRNRSGIDAARERATSAAFRVEAERLDIIAARRSALAQVAASGQRVNAAEESEEAALDAYRLGRIGYDAGKTALVELLSIRRVLAEAQVLTIDARLARVRALANLSLTEGRLVFGEVP
jgi:cobalt-zinc-cadmium efflux system outer membrane protein